MPRTSLIAVLSKQTRAIGKDGGLIWNLPGELARFKRITNGHPVIMGRKTWESIPAKFRPLPGRTNIVVTRDESYEAPGAIVTYSFEDALVKARAVPDNDEIFVIGGGQLYLESLPYADRLYLSLVDDPTEGDAYFPDYQEFSTSIEKESCEENGIRYELLTLER
ncbi:MAG TPA: dihydrofolate reductase [Candidatus Paceibacterota bacterium]|nr:dihydrofolate reductase [Candidatus Paceibacterota bacterium]